MAIATPKRWRFVRGHDKPRRMGVASDRSFPGGIDTTPNDRWNSNLGNSGFRLCPNYRRFEFDMTPIGFPKMDLWKTSSAGRNPAKKKQLPGTLNNHF